MLRLFYFFLSLLTVQPLLAAELFSEADPFMLQTYQEFVRKAPFSGKDMVLSKNTAEKIEFSGSNRGEISFWGQVAPERELYLDHHRLSMDASRSFHASIFLHQSEESHEFILKDSRSGQMKSFPFKIRLEKEPPLPLRVKFQTEGGDIVLRELLFKGAFASEEYLRLLWLNPREKSDSIPGHDENNCLIADYIEFENQRPPSELKRAISNALSRLESPEQLSVIKNSGLEIEQGIGFFNLSPSNGSGATELKSTNWVVNLRLKKKLRDNLHWEVGGSTFIVPVSVSGAAAGPRLFKLEAGLGLTQPLSESFSLSPGMGLRYQTLFGSSSVGYQNLLGARFSLGQTYELGHQKSLHSLVSFALFNGDGSLISTANRELGVKAYYQWGTDSSWISSYYLGGEWTTLSLSLSGTALSSSLYSGFLGVLF